MITAKNNGEVVAQGETQKEIAEKLVELNFSSNAVKTTSEKVGKALKRGVNMFGLSFEEINEEELESVSNTAKNEEVKNQNEEVVEEIEEVNEESVDETSDLNDQDLEDEVEVIEEDEEIEETPSDEKSEEEEKESDKSDEKEDEGKNKRRRGIGVEYYLDEQFVKVYPSIQAAAREIKELSGYKAMPYTPIHKSLRDHIDWEYEGHTYKFRFENDEDRKDEYKTRTASGNGRRGAGKSVEWYVDGEHKQTFDSIKSAVQALKDELGLEHNPYTAVNKSLKDDIDFNQHSFRYADEEQSEEETKEEQGA